MREIPVSVLLNGDVIVQTGLQGALLVVVESSFEPIEFQFHGRPPAGDAPDCPCLGSTFWAGEMAGESAGNGLQALVSVGDKNCLG